MHLGGHRQWVPLPRRMTLTCCARLIISKYNSSHLRDGYADLHLCLQIKDCSILYEVI